MLSNRAIRKDVGPQIATIHLNDIDASGTPSVRLDTPNQVSSYNWMEADMPTIMVPGSLHSGLADK
jgi:hypothetical protein